MGYLALKSGAPVIPAAIIWDKPRPLNLLGTLLKPGKAEVRYGRPILVQPEPRPRPDSIRAVTSSIMGAIQEIEKDNR